MMMNPRTVSTINTKVEALALLTEDDLKGMTLAALRKKLSETGISRIERDGGVTVAVNSARKVEVIQTIRDLTKKERIIAVVAPMVNSIDESELGDFEEPDRTWGDPESAGKFFFEAVKKYTTSYQWDSATQVFKAPGSILNQYATKMALRFATLSRLNTSEDLALSSKLWFRSETLREMRQLAEMESGEWYGTQLLLNVETIRTQVFGGMREMSDQHARERSANVDVRVMDSEKVDTTLMVDRAYKVLSELQPGTPSYKWREVSCALAFVTGRRMAEIHSSAQFVEVDEYLVSFTGQLKAKGEQAARYAENPSYDIPTLIPARFVVSALKWLDDNSKRIPEPKKVNGKYAKELSLYVRNEWYARVMPDMVANDERRTDEKHCTYHRLRQLYALCAVESFRPSNLYVNKYMSMLLGHSVWDTKTSQRYEMDVELMQGSKTSTR